MKKNNKKLSLIVKFEFKKLNPNKFSIKTKLDELVNSNSLVHGENENLFTVAKWKSPMKRMPQLSVNLADIGGLLNFKSMTHSISLKSLMPLLMPTTPYECLEKATDNNNNIVQENELDTNTSSSFIRENENAQVNATSSCLSACKVNLADISGLIDMGNLKGTTLISRSLLHRIKSFEKAVKLDNR